MPLMIPPSLEAVNLLTDASRVALAADCATLTPLQVAAGLVTWLGVMRVLVVVGGIACVAVLLLTWFRFLLGAFAAVPVVVYEVVGYAVSAGLVASAPWTTPGDAAWTTPIGALLFGAVLLAAGAARGAKARPDVVSVILFAVWATVALWSHDQVVGFAAVLALMGTLGFTAGVIPFGYVIGFTGEDAVPRATVAALAVTVAAVAWRASGASPSNPFLPGALWVGPFVAGLGLLIAASRHYHSASPWLLRQAAPLALGLAALLLGNEWGIHTLSGIGGAFFVLYLVEKATDVPVESQTQAALLGLLTCCVVGSGVWWAEAHMDVVSPYLLF